MATNMKIALTKLGLDMNSESKNVLKQAAYGRLDFDKSSLKWNYDSLGKKIYIFYSLNGKSKSIHTLAQALLCAMLWLNFATFARRVSNSSLPRWHKNVTYSRTKLAVGLIMDSLPEWTYFRPRWQIYGEGGRRRQKMSSFLKSEISMENVLSTFEKYSRLFVKICTFGFSRLINM